eukprot:TRINITY_DN38941_c0_g1_i1.p1 TRINITY_DN38941_c0_g1~~TRINITY_DN38941_c0_g1_i1.p1  ORF type:complete len:262 (-),score=65.60 TRINITY_DN38941_c0_g1_i1:4-789(-)
MVLANATVTLRQRKHPLMLALLVAVLKVSTLVGTQTSSEPSVPHQEEPPPLASADIAETGAAHSDDASHGDNASHGGAASHGGNASNGVKASHGGDALSKGGGVSHGRNASHGDDDSPEDTASHSGNVSHGGEHGEAGDAGSDGGHGGHGKDFAAELEKLKEWALAKLLHAANVEPDEALYEELLQTLGAFREDTIKEKLQEAKHRKLMERYEAELKKEHGELMKEPHEVPHDRAMLGYLGLFYVGLSAGLLCIKIKKPPE